MILTKHQLVLPTHRLTCGLFSKCSFGIHTSPFPGSYVLNSFPSLLKHSAKNSHSTPFPLPEAEDDFVIFSLCHVQHH